jgi:hypothetical protein
MATATIQNVIDLGFDAAQFGNPTNFATASGYVDSILTGIGLVVADKLGAAYAGAGGLIAYRIVEAEKYLVAAELCRRQANFNARRVAVSRTDVVTELENERLLARAEKYEAFAMQHLQELGVDIEAGIAAGLVESTHFGVAV